MSSFREDINRFKAKIVVDTRDLFVNVCSAAHESIVNGSPITGAPGQPVDTGRLRGSWHLEFVELPDGAMGAQITTNVTYGPIIEDNVRGVVFKNHGPHSVKLTRAGLPRLIQSEARKRAGTP